MGGGVGYRLVHVRIVVCAAYVGEIQSDRCLRSGAATHVGFLGLFFSVSGNLATMAAFLRGAGRAAGYIPFFFLTLKNFNPPIDGSV